MTDDLGSFDSSIPGFLRVYAEAAEASAANALADAAAEAIVAFLA